MNIHFLFLLLLSILVLYYYYYHHHHHHFKNIRKYQYQKVIPQIHAQSSLRILQYKPGNLQRERPPKRIQEASMLVSALIV